ncbi:uncharacterized protein LOC122074612 [Macadamia integrifolia]|uniref:uncharacterized protein LOC122074612 n=1 Tax=Macadamia integrifolia TaxID=60698 RepID=UPI001C4E8E4E|nr:uncharacterized protein LOC122074612 [Macadamia integrifolia]
MLSIGELAMDSWFSPSNLTGIFVGPDQFWRENTRGCWVTILVLLFLFICQPAKRALTLKRRRRRRQSVSVDGETTVSRPGNSQTRISEIISVEDLRNLINSLDGKLNEKENWENIIDKRNNLLSYSAKCCKPKDGPLKYLSVTIFENCSPEFLRDFYMDNEYRKLWDKMVVEHEQLQIDETTGIEIGRTVKKFPFLTPREYVLAWRLWEGKEKTFYCFIKACEHDLAPRRKKYVRVGFFHSGWCIKKVPGRDACEIKMVHQEDAGLNVEMAKLAFAKGIWNYVCKMDLALRGYAPTNCPLPRSVMTAVILVQKVPPGLETVIMTASPALSRSVGCAASQRVTDEIKERKILRRPSRKSVANCLLLLGGVICLSRGHSSLGAKVAMAYILKKLSKHGASSSQAGQSGATLESLH